MKIDNNIFKEKLTTLIKSLLERGGTMHWGGYLCSFGTYTEQGILSVMNGNSCGAEEAPSDKWSTIASMCSIFMIFLAMHMIVTSKRVYNHHPNIKANQVFSILDVQNGGTGWWGRCHLHSVVGGLFSATVRIVCNGIFWLLCSILHNHPFMSF